MAKIPPVLSKQIELQNTLDEGIKDLPQTNEHFHKQLIASLRRRRESIGLSQKKLGEMIGITDYLLAKWEGNHRRPSGFLLWCWAEALDVKLVIRKR
jgi:DNA-binding transcriptional regulator YiaG